MDPILIVWLCLMAGLVALIVVIAVRAVRRRNRGLRNARSHGWQVLREADGLAHYWTGPPFDRSHASVGDAVQGTYRGFPFVCFKYHYSVGSDTPGEDNTSRPETLVVLAVTLRTSLPDLAVEPHGSVTRFIDRVRGEPDMTVGVEEFDKAFKITASDHEFAGQLLQDPSLQALLTAADRPWMIQRGDFLTYDLTPDFLPGEPSMVDELELLLKPVYQIPGPLWDRYGGKPAQL